MEDLDSGSISLRSVGASLPSMARSRLALLSPLQPWSTRRMKLPKLCRHRRGLCSLPVTGLPYMTVSAKRLAAAIRTAKRCSVSLRGSPCENHDWVVGEQSGLGRRCG
jgi:hypothetical protein